MRRRSAAIAVVGLAVGAGLCGAVAVRSSLSVPPHVIEASVTRTPELLERAWRLPVAVTYDRRITWQSNASRCGPAALANVYRSLGDAADTEDEVLAATGRCWTGVCVLGLTLDELADVARTNPRRKITVVRDIDEHEFRRHLRGSNDPGRRYVANFDRKPIFGAGVGHHSPIGGYLEAEDLVLVLDVNQAYRPWLIEAKRLFDAIDTVDGGVKRGLLLIE